MKNTANTSVLVQDGRVYALCEIGKPFQISPDDLSTLGEVDFDGVVRQAFNAHPHRVPSRATTYGFGQTMKMNTEVDFASVFQPTTAVTRASCGPTELCMPCVLMSGTPMPGCD
jgi:carotenoid cleavage dioxygenase-like enzyme